MTSPPTRSADGNVSRRALKCSHSAARTTWRKRARGLRRQHASCRTLLRLPCRKPSCRMFPYLGTMVNCVARVEYAYELLDAGLFGCTWHWRRALGRGDTGEIAESFESVRQPTASDDGGRLGGFRTRCPLGDFAAPSDFEEA